MHPDQDRINQIIVKVKNPQQIIGCLTELTGLIRNDIANTSIDKMSKIEYFREFENYMKTSLSKVSSPALKTELNSQLIKLISTQQRDLAQ